MGKSHRKFHYSIDVKINIELYGLQETQPFNVLLEKGTSLGLHYHRTCYKKCVNTKKLEELIERVSRQVVIGKYLTGKSNLWFKKHKIYRKNYSFIKSLSLYDRVSKVKFRVGCRILS